MTVFFTDGMTVYIYTLYQVVASLSYHLELSDQGLGRLLQGTLSEDVCQSASVGT